MPDSAAPRDEAMPEASTGGRGRTGVRWESLLLYLVAIGLIYYSTVNNQTVGGRWPLHAALLPFVIAALVLRSRLPYALPLVGIVVVAAGSPAVFPVGLLSLAMRREGLRVWLVGVLGWGVALATLYRSVFEDSLEFIVQVVPLGFLLIAAVPILAGRYIRRSRQRESAATARAVRAEIEQELAADRAVGAERERIAREMHDSLGHVLTLVTTQAGALEVSTKDPAVRAAAESIRSTARRGLADLRAVVRVLGDEEASRGPARGLTAIPDLIEESRGAGAVVTLTGAAGLPEAELPDSTGRLLYRIVQEALTNAHRHAPGSPVDIALSGAPGSGIEITVGNPLAPGGERGAGSGLDALRSRIDLLGGELDARAARGRFELHARLPWEAA
ncbi:sensor histidine kinase [Microbacterium sp.]|uniref:sensor histidine kinase n=1 Tax=Microbacterium sp. TaxID=51671 RepID=UPI0039E58E68